jgi:membrane-bound inhibitor of C-type lysozyme
MKKILWILLVLIVGGTIALAFTSRERPALVGGDKDAHGCLGSAGYSWCDARASCIRPWETFCTAVPPKQVLFKCKDGKTISASFYPSDDKFVDLVLSDGRNMSVPRAMSGSGARYAKSDESFVFWNKGDTAFITEGASSTETYSNCSL